jgi:hypothetical protein
MFDLDAAPNGEDFHSEPAPAAHQSRDIRSRCGIPATSIRNRVILIHNA